MNAFTPVFEAPLYKNPNNNAFIPDVGRPINPLTFLTDSYKVSHIEFEIEGVKEIYSNFTARFGKYMQNMVGAAWDNQYVVFGTQYAILEMQHLFKTGFFDRFKSEVMREMKDVHVPYIGWNKFDHFEKLHDLGYLPIVVKALPEGTLAPIGCPFLTIRNTLPEFEWLPNYLETLLSVLIWKPLTIATMARFFRLKTNEFALKTNGNLLGTEWQNHDFHVRGASGWQSAAINGCAFLLSSCGTDNMPSLDYAQRYYGTSNKSGVLAGSVSAGEHSVTTMGILTYAEKLKKGLAISEEMYVRYVLSKFPTGIFSYVSDSFDYWTLVGAVLPRVKDKIMERDGKFVVRGDSGDPVEVICGAEESAYIEISLEDAATYDDFVNSTSAYIHDDLAESTPHGECGDSEHSLNFKWNGKLYNVSITNFEWNRHDKQYYYLDQYEKYNHVVTEIERSVEHKGTIEALWDIFGGTVNELGYKVLDSHIGMIYGDGITLKRQHEILSRLEAKGFASTNIVFGVGSYSLNLVGRDHLGMAIKATNAIVEIEGNIVDKPIYKEPKTDTSKKSARGLLMVVTVGNKVISWSDCCTRDSESQGALRVIFKDSEVFNLETLFTIRNRLWLG